MAASGIDEKFKSRFVNESYFKVSKTPLVVTVDVWHH